MSYPRSHIGYIEEDFLAQLAEEARTKFGVGKVADYIPALAEVEPDQFGMAICHRDGRVQSCGDALVPFSIQSISKVISLVIAMRHADEFGLWQRLRQEPSGMPFSSLIQLEREEGIPRNPFVNAGALVIVDILVEKIFLILHHMREFVREHSGNRSINYDARVAESELRNTSRNAAIAHLIKSFGNIHGDVNRVLEVYCHFCALGMNCVDLARLFSFLASAGHSPISSQQLLSADQAREVNGMMLTCGLYDASGSYAAQVGLPAKSGVGGGIVAVLPGEFTVCAWSPRLDANGNSVGARWALEKLVDYLGRSPLG
ncbi:glutaminase B [Biformimicrobium ophioploci]|uniref:Glutaminase n=1 Tax=Biformimicrobium ophioploci TaxID=3036711 RepID=A0ABQ6LUM0_9GAMM|nr:glutaminase B [Microbulbifer sp. NKW57]GMG85761.1 glutaminase B [Microbulbifer sp. NKW57]